MFVVDTSAWIEWLSDTELGRQLSHYFESRDRCIVPTMVQHELYKWLVREVSEEAAERVIGFTQTCIVTPLDTDIALRAAELCRERKLAAADAIIYASALSRQAQSVTCDAHFAHLDDVIYLPKAPR